MRLKARLLVLAVTVGVSCVPSSTLVQQPDGGSSVDASLPPDTTAPVGPDAEAYGPPDASVSMPLDARVPDAFIAPPADAFTVDVALPDTRTSPDAASPDAPPVDATTPDAPIVVSIASVKPAKGPTAGGTQVVIAGHGFGTDTSGLTVTFDGLPAKSIDTASDTALQVTTPSDPGAFGKGPVAVSVSRSSSADTKQLFTFWASTFALSTLPSLDLGAVSAGLAVGDFDENGAPDLAVTLDMSNQLVILLNNNDQSGTFTKIHTYDAGSYPVRVTAGDFATGHRDLVTTNFNNGNVGSVDFWLGDGNGGFTRLAQSGGSGGLGGQRLEQGTYGVALMDVNGDQKLDIVATNYTANTIDVLLGRNGGAFDPYLSSPSGGLAYQCAVADFAPAKGQLGAACGDNGATGQIFVLTGDNAGHFFAGTASPSGRAVQGTATGDLDEDGFIDIIGASTTGSVTVLLNRRTLPGTFVSNDIQVAGCMPSDVTLSDMNGDGHLDALIPCENGGLAVLLGRGDGTFQTPDILFQAGDEAAVAAVADFDGDGRPDVAVTAANDTHLSIFLNSSR